jgi:glycosyltransferase involved in cell wall biosynthesis
MVSTPFVAVPPPQYGGTELIVAELVDGLIERGHKVVLFATGDSTGGYRHHCPVRARFPSRVWPPSAYAEADHSAFAYRQIARGGFDLVHAHCPASLPFARFASTPTLFTIHNGCFPELKALYARHHDIDFVSISRRQQQLCGPLPRCTVIHHGVDPSRYRLAEPRTDTVAFLGRLSAVKGPHVAIDVALAAGLRIRLGGRHHEEDEPYYQAELKRRLEQPRVEHLGEVSHEPKVELLSTARAMLFPIEWEEPFGLVMIEAMLCGCPVIAFAHGAAPEVIDEGITGFIARDPQHMLELLQGPARPEFFDRRRCRAHAAMRFNSDRMVDDYLRLYEQISQAAIGPVTGFGDWPNA